MLQPPPDTFLFLNLPPAPLSLTHFFSVTPPPPPCTTLHHPSTLPIHFSRNPPHPLTPPPPHLLQAPEAFPRVPVGFEVFIDEVCGEHIYILVDRAVHARRYAYARVHAYCRCGVRMRACAWVSVHVPKHARLASLPRSLFCSVASPSQGRSTLCARAGAAVATETLRAGATKA